MLVKGGTGINITIQDTRRTGSYDKLYLTKYQHDWHFVVFCYGLLLIDCICILQYCFNSLRPRQHGRHFADDIFKCIFLDEDVWIPIKISLKFVPKGPINNILALVQIMAWRRPGDKPLSEPMMVSLPTHICIARPQWVNGNRAIEWLLQVQLWRIRIIWFITYSNINWYRYHNKQSTAQRLCW